MKINKEYKVLKEFPDYRVYNDGTIISYRNPKPKKIIGKYDKDGYKEYQLRDSFGNAKFRRGHRLVALAFLGEPSGNRNVINHKNGIKDDNKVENLEWCSISENTQHGFDVLGRKASRQKGRAVDVFNKEGELVKSFTYCCDAAEYLGVTAPNAHKNMLKNSLGQIPSRGFHRYLIKKQYYILPHNNESVETIEQESNLT